MYKRQGLPFAPVDEPSRGEWMPLMAGFAEMDMDTANGVMIREFFAGLDLRAGLPALRGIVKSMRPDVIVRESWEFGSTLVAELHEIPIARVGLGLAEMESLSVELAAPAVDKVRAELGLPPDPGGERMTAAPFFTAMPGELDDPAATLPARTSRFRFEVSAGAEELPDWWAG